eukprot:7980440-Pyramimonas_sp.AAC.1
MTARSNGLGRRGPLRLSCSRGSRASSRIRPSWGSCCRSRNLAGSPTLGRGTRGSASWPQGPTSKARSGSEILGMNSVG